MNTNNTQNTLMDSPEALGHALCKKPCDGETLCDLARKIAARIG